MSTISPGAMAPSVLLAALNTLPTVIEGTAGLIVKLTGFEPATVTLALPAAAIRLAGTAALNCVALANVVANGDPFHCTVEPERKPVPVTVSVKAGPPAVAELGARVAMVPTGSVMPRRRRANPAGPFPAAKGEPGTGVKAPLAALIVYAEMVLEKKFDT